MRRTAVAKCCGLCSMPVKVRPALMAATPVLRMVHWAWGASFLMFLSSATARRTGSFDEVQGGLTEGNALFEARRCLSCGNCFECDNCYGVCPDNAVIKLGPGQRFQFNYDYCKGCGLCAAECPCGAIDMQPEQV